MRDRRPQLEQRKHARSPVQCTARLRLPEGAGVPDVPAVEARDISLGGMYLDCEVSLPFGQSLEVILNEGTPSEMALPAVVRWNKPGGFGVQFGLLGARDTHTLLTLIKTCAS